MYDVQWLILWLNLIYIKMYNNFQKLAFKKMYSQDYVVLLIHEIISLNIFEAYSASIFTCWRNKSVLNTKLYFCELSFENLPATFPPGFTHFRAGKVGPVSTQKLSCELCFQVLENS